jgi:asparagine synthase (glutamine-hydrolysing)
VHHRTTYFRPSEWEEQEILEPEHYYRELRAIFAARLPHYFSGSEAVGISVTGGLDTRMILAWHRPPAGSLPCYTFGGALRECRDVRVGREVAAAARQPHQVITVGEEFLSRFPEYAERTVYYSDGCADVSRSADLYVNERARLIAPVRMTGNYGGEVLRRVRAFKPMPLRPGLFAPEFVPHLERAQESYQRVIDGHPLSFAVFRQAPWHHYGLLALEQTQLTLRSPFLDNAFVKTVFRAPQETLGDNDVCLRLIADGDPAMAAIPSDRGLAIRRGSIGSHLARGVHELTFKAEYAYDYGMRQWMVPIDRALAIVRPERLFLGRHKFCHFRVWYRNALSGFVRDMLTGPNVHVRQYVDSAVLTSVVDEHTSGSGNWTTELHKLLTVELIHRSLLHGVGAADR